MALSQKLVFAALLGGAAFSLPLPLTSQTLEHRPPPQSPPHAPAHDAPVPPKHDEERVIPAGTSLQVEIPRKYAMKTGEAIEGRLVFPIYSEGKLLVPANTPVRGAVSSLEPDPKTRWHARLRGDFTPFHIARVQFDELVIDGRALPLKTTGAKTGAPVLRLVSSGAANRESLVARQWNQMKTQAHDRIAFFTAPGRGDRALEMLYHQLPYHPERIPAHTAWTTELAAPLGVPDSPNVASAPPPSSIVPGKQEVWSVHALLTAEVTSAHAKPGDQVQALVTEPVFDKDRQLVVPQGSTLVGRVTTAKSARSLGRNGKLRFTFQQVRFPEGSGLASPDRPVQGALAGATTAGVQGLSMDAEGTVTPKNQSSAVAPLLLTFLAGRALDQDGNLTAQTSVSSNGFGLIGRVVGIAAGNRNLAAGLGFYEAALSTYDNFLRPGNDVDFPKDTRIEIQTTPLRAPILKAENR